MPCNGTGALRIGHMKLMVGSHGHAGHYGHTRTAIYSAVYEAAWCCAGHFSPNRSFTKNMSGLVLCSIVKPCLFNVTADMAEAHDLAAKHPQLVKHMLARYHWYDTQYHP